MAPNHHFNTDEENADGRMSTKEVLESIAYAISTLTISIVFWWFIGGITCDFVNSIKHDLTFLAYP